MSAVDRPPQVPPLLRDSDLVRFVCYEYSSVYGTLRTPYIWPALSVHTTYAPVGWWFDYACLSLPCPFFTPLALPAASWVVTHSRMHTSMRACVLTYFLHTRTHVRGEYPSGIFLKCCQSSLPVGQSWLAGYHGQIHAQVQVDDHVSPTQMGRALLPKFVDSTV